MARLHSGKHGKSSRKRPKIKVCPEWVDASKDEIEKIIIDLAKKGTPPAKIGLILRDQYAIPSVRAFLGKSLSKFLKEKNLLPQYPEDLLNLIRKAVRMREHLKQAKKDIHNRVKLTHVESKIHRLVKYYTKTKRLPHNWTYDPETAALLVK